MLTFVLILYCTGLAGFLMAVVALAEIHPASTAPGDVSAWAAVTLLAVFWPVAALAVPALRRLYLHGGVRTRRVLRLVRPWQLVARTGFQPTAVQFMKPSA